MKFLFRYYRFFFFQVFLYLSTEESTPYCQLLRPRSRLEALFDKSSKTLGLTICPETWCSQLENLYLGQKQGRSRAIFCINLKKMWLCYKIKKFFWNLVLNLCHNDRSYLYFLIAFWKVAPSKHTLEGQFLQLHFIGFGGHFFKRTNWILFKNFDLLIKCKLIKGIGKKFDKETERMSKCTKKKKLFCFNRFSTFIFLNLSWSSWLENLKVLLCFLFIERKKCSHFVRMSWSCFWREGHDQNNGVSLRPKAEIRMPNWQNKSSLLPNLVTAFWLVLNSHILFMFPFIAVTFEIKTLKFSHVRAKVNGLYQQDWGCTCAHCSVSWSKILSKALEQLQIYAREVEISGTHFPSQQ